MDEKSELDAKLAKLSEFIRTNPVFGALPSEERARLVLQRGYMVEYSRILGERIAAFS